MQRLGAKFRVRSRIDWYSFLSVKYISQRILLAQLWFVIYSKDEWFHVVCVALSSVSHITEWGLYLICTLTEARMPFSIS